MTTSKSRIEYLRDLYDRWAADLDRHGPDDPEYAQNLAEALDDLSALIKDVETSERSASSRARRSRSSVRDHHLN